MAVRTNYASIWLNILKIKEKKTKICLPRGLVVEKLAHFHSMNSALPLPLWIICLFSTVEWLWDLLNVRVKTAIMTSNWKNLCSQWFLWVGYQRSQADVQSRLTLHPTHQGIEFAALCCNAAFIILIKVVSFCGSCWLFNKTGETQ